MYDVLGVHQTTISEDLRFVGNPSKANEEEPGFDGNPSKTERQKEFVEKRDAQLTEEARSGVDFPPK
jgi:hypothetical protein